MTWDAVIVNGFAKPSVVYARSVEATQTRGSVHAQPVAKRTLPSLTGADIEAIATAAHSKILSGPDADRLRLATQRAKALPAMVDKSLLHQATIYAGRMLREPEKRQLRIAFKALL